MKLSLKLALKLSVLSHGNIAFDEISPRHVSIRIRYCFSLCFPAGKFSIFRATPVSHRRKSGISEMFGLFFFLVQIARCISVVFCLLVFYEDRPDTKSELRVWNWKNSGDVNCQQCYSSVVCI